MLLAGPSEHDPGLRVDICGLPVEVAQSLHAELDRLRQRLNVYRGQVIDVGVGPMGQAVLSFASLPVTDRDDVVLPEMVLDRIERHALGVSRHREALLAAHQHLKRGLLLFGPPGTGKTHTTRYLVGQMTGYTRLLLTGRSLHAVGSTAELARDLAPAALVLEDVDLVAEDRSVLESLHDHDPLRTVTAAHTTRALEDLLDGSQQVTRSLLGVGNDPETLPPGGGAPAPAPTGGWVAYTGRSMRRAHRFP